MKLETTDKPTIANDPFESWWYYQGLGLFDGKLTKNELRGAFAAGRLGEFEGEATELKKERDTLLARNEELECKVAALVRAASDLIGPVEPGMNMGQVFLRNEQARSALRKALADIEGDGE